MPHGHCYLWRPTLVYLHVLSDGLIALAYAFISVSLLILWRRIKLPFNGMLVGFGLFIFLCGCTHAMEIWTLWNADYWASGFVKAGTALASISTAIVTVYVAPQIVSFVEEFRLSEGRRVELEAAREASLVKDRFLATVTHELRAPLNVIIGYSQMLRLEPENRELVAEAISAIERNAELQNKLIGDLLDVSRITAGKLKLHPEKVNVAELVRECENGITFDAQSKKIEVIVDVEEPRAEIVADRMRLGQVVSNLLSNAVKYTPKGGRVRVALRRRPGSSFEISVSDNGVGIEAPFLSHVFEPFTQEAAPRDRIGGGLGLGLSIACNLVQLHGGKIEAKSEGKGKGSTFIVSLPIAPLEDWVPPQVALGATFVTEKLDEENIRLEGVRILLVDDETDSRQMLSTALTMAKAQVSSFSSAQEALKVLATDSKYSVIISDIDMPGMNGFEFIRSVRSLGGATAEIPALALTAYLQEAERGLAIQAGFQVFIQKPVSIRRLATTLVDMIDKAKKQA